MPVVKTLSPEPRLLCTQRMIRACADMNPWMHKHVMGALRPEPAMQVHTTDDAGAGTDAVVHLTMHGRDGDGAVHTLSGGYDSFGRYASRA